MPAQMAKCEMVKIHKAIELSEVKPTCETNRADWESGPIFQHLP